MNDSPVLCIGLSFIFQFLEEEALPETVLDWGINFILGLQAALPGWAIGPLNFFTFLGYEEWFLLMMPFVFWCLDPRLGFRLGIYLTAAGILTGFLKVNFHDPRPYWIDPRVQLLAEGDPWFGIPSGHALTGVAVWGGLAAGIRKNWAWLAAGFIIFMIGLSRIVLGVHYPTDVLAGWIIGAILLYLMVRFEDGIAGFYNRFSFTGQVLLALLPALVLIVTGITLNNTFSANFPLPEAWESTSLAAGNPEMDPYRNTVYTTNAAVFFGTLVGYTWLAMHGGFDAGGAWGRRILRYAVGMIGAVALWAGLDAVFAAIAADATLLGIVLRFIRYSLVGFWVAALAPRIFIRLGWAGRGE
jgi:membrane-associated phospholipid phosphatase